MIKKQIKEQYQGHGGILKDLMVTDKKKLTQFEKKTLSLPRINLNPRQICDLELLMNGGFSPLEGFMDEDNYISVVENMRLNDGTLWPIPIVFDVDDIKDYKTGSELILCDEYGTPLALFTVSSIYKPDKRREVRKVYGTTDETHFGVRYVMQDVGEYYLGGRIEGYKNVDRFDFDEYRLTPKELQKWFKKNKWEKIIGFQTRNPLHKAHYSLIETAAKDHNASVLIHPSVGMTKDGDIDYVTRVKCYIKLHENYAKHFTKIALLPLAMRMGGPREAVWHAIIRKNYGCTHFIVGRDHAGPGKDKNGKPFYGPYDAQDLILKHEKELGIIVVPFKEMVYIEEDNKYYPADILPKGKNSKNISGTEFRRRLLGNEEIPEWFSFPEIIAELRRGLHKQKKDGLTIFFTGLPSAGKSTIAKMLYFKLLELQDKKITLLDGDVVRQNLSKGLGFSRDDRNSNITRIGFVANEITKHRGIVICAAIAPYEEARQKNRSMISKNGNYIQIYLSTPLSVCKKRDVKGLYKKTSMGKMKGMTGVDDPYEKPKNSELVIDTSKVTPQHCVDTIIKYLTNNNLISIS